MPLLKLTPSSVIKNEVCRNHALHTLQHLATGSQWALRMFDASTKFQSGILDGNVIDLGNFDECIDVNVEEEWGAFKGQHCLASTSVNLEGKKNIPLKFSLCVPSTCTPTDLTNFLTALFRHRVEVTSSGCHTNDPRPYTTADSIAIAIFCIFGLLSIISTTYDLTISDPKKRKTVLMAFSWYSNGKQLFSTKSGNGETIDCLHGLRYLSAVFIIVGHTYLLSLWGPTRNMMELKHTFQDWPHVTIAGDAYAVETFFILSGCLLSYLFLKSMRKGRKFNLLMFYIHRYVRLTPLLCIAALVHAGIIMHFGNGPMWEMYLEWFPKACQKNWWITFFYLHNYVHYTEMCMTYSWYLAVDMQLYILSPLLLLPLLKWPRFGQISLLLSIIASVLACFIHTYMDKVESGYQDGSPIPSVYFYTHTRAISWLMGLCLGVILFKTMQWRESVINGTSKGLSKKCVYLGWLVAFICLISPLLWTHNFTQVEYVPHALENALYNSVTRPLWATGVCWVIFACMTGYGGPLNTFLSWKLFQPLSRLTYSIYLVHYPFLLVKFSAVKTAVYWSDVDTVRLIFGAVVIVTLISIPAYLMFESPAIILMKLLEGGKKSTSHNVHQLKKTTMSEDSNIVAGFRASHQLHRSENIPSQFTISNDENTTRYGTQ